jgi:hypothetical protein
LVLVSHPFRLEFSLVLQSLYPAVQLAMLHSPLVQLGVPFTVLQGKPQFPQ